MITANYVKYLRGTNYKKLTRGYARPSKLFDERPGVQQDAVRWFA